jgi:hypothetical protein
LSLKKRHADAGGRCRGSVEGVVHVIAAGTDGREQRTGRACETRG